MDPAAGDRDDPFWLDACGVGATALLLLVLSAPAFGIETIHMYPFLNDQAGYITSARWLADTGELRSHLIYSAYAGDPDWRLYMPGHFYLLAGAFSVFGYGPLVARLPSLAGFVVCAVSVQLIGRKLYGRGAGWIAAGLFMTLPFVGFFAFSAMAELTVTASVATCFAIFVHLPKRIRFWATPALLVLPFLFRETTALLVIPMSMSALSPWPDRSWVRFLFASIGSVVTLSLVNIWQISLGKEPMPLSWVTHGSFNYADATRNVAPNPSLGEWISGLQSNLSSNLELLRKIYGTKLLDTPEPLTTAAIAVIALVVFVWGTRHWRRDLFPIGVALMTLGAMLLTLLAYNVIGFRVFRTSLFAVPLLLAALGGLVAIRVIPLARRLAPSLSRRSAFLGYAGLVLAIGLPSMRLSAATIDRVDLSAVSRAIERLELPHDTVLVSDLWIAYDYILEHYPVRWAFPPENVETLRLLCAHHPIGIVIEKPQGLLDRLPPEAVEALGLIRDSHVIRIWGMPLAVFKTRETPVGDEPCVRRLVP